MSARLIHVQANSSRFPGVCSKMPESTFSEYTRPPAVTSVRQKNGSEPSTVAVPLTAT